MGKQVMQSFLEEHGKLEYIRRGPLSKETRKPTKKKGILLAYPLIDSVVIGWSLCHPIEDKFDAEHGVQIALDRAISWEKNWENKKKTCNSIDFIHWVYKRVPDSIKDELIRFVLKMRKYYKNKTFPEWVEEL